MFIDAKHRAASLRQLSFLFTPAAAGAHVFTLSVLIVEFYLYPTVSTALIYLLKPESNK